MLYIYAITERVNGAIPKGCGFEGAPLVSVVHRDLAAVVSLLAAAEPAVSEANVLRHEAVVETLMADGPVLPLRFGTILHGEAEAQALLSRHYTSFVGALERVRGRVELGLRVLWGETMTKQNRGARERESEGLGEHGREPSPPHYYTPAQIGRQYLLGCLEEERRALVWHQRAEALAAEIHTPLARLAAESKQQVLVTPRMLLTAAYLVGRQQVDAFRAQAEALAQAFPALRLLCTGPWPPYSFVAGCVPERWTDDGG